MILGDLAHQGRLEQFDATGAFGFGAGRFKAWVHGGLQWLNGSGLPEWVAGNLA